MTLLWDANTGVRGWLAGYEEMIVPDEASDLCWIAEVSVSCSLMPSSHCSLDWIIECLRRRAVQEAIIKVKQQI